MEKHYGSSQCSVGRIPVQCRAFIGPHSPALCIFFLSLLIKEAYVHHHHERSLVNPVDFSLSKYNPCCSYLSMNKLQVIPQLVAVTWLTNLQFTTTYSLKQLTLFKFMKNISLRVTWSLYQWRPDAGSGPRSYHLTLSVARLHVWPGTQSHYPRAHSGSYSSSSVITIRVCD